MHGLWRARGFSIHAGVAIAAGNKLGRELLSRCCARPPFSLERLTALPDGRFAYRLKTPWRRDETHRIMTDTELLGRLAALVPPPRHPLNRFHGVLAPHSAWRASVVPAPRSPCNARGSIACVVPVHKRRSRLEDAVNSAQETHMALRIARACGYLPREEAGRGLNIIPVRWTFANRR